MGFFLRKSIKVGPFRINLSKSGIGVSGGIKGARISAGPRGSQLNLGRKGVYYRKQLSPGSRPVGSWLARLIAYFFPSKDAAPIPRTPPELSPEKRVAEFMLQSGIPQPAREQSAPAFNAPLQRTKVLPPKPFVSYENYTMPSVALLTEAPNRTELADEELLATATRLAERLKEFGVFGQFKHIAAGPIFTTYEYQLDPGVKYSRLTSLADDLCMCERIPYLIAIEGSPSRCQNNRILS